MDITAIYPGTFDPITLGHIDVASRAAKMFDRLVIAVAASPGKEPYFDLKHRSEMVEQVLSEHSNVQVATFSGLLVNFAKKQNASVIVRGLRTITDFDYEAQFANLNRQMEPEVETVFVVAASQYTFVSSSIVREIASLGGDVSEFVDPLVESALNARNNKK